MCLNCKKVKSQKVDQIYWQNAIAAKQQKSKWEKRKSEKVILR